MKLDTHFERARLIVPNHLSVVLDIGPKNVMVILLLIFIRCQLINHILNDRSLTRWIRASQHQASRAIIDRCANISYRTNREAYMRGTDGFW